MMSYAKLIWIKKRNTSCKGLQKVFSKTDEDREYGTEVIERISNSDTTREDADFIIRCTEVIDNLIDKVFEEKVANKS